ncbi:MAG: hypothetical protein OEZ68_02375 [Gammaproteobacteria bacterium]|nr:hypothetical protein [Gammaproteobacteria bacterium]MDH5799628.1 hypothetical protein [Gammaproteobacteria bacterium]
MQLSLQLTKSIDLKPDRHLRGQAGNQIFYIIPATTRASYYINVIQEISDGYIVEGTTVPVKKSNVLKELSRFNVDVEWKQVPGGKWARNYWLSVI